MRCIYDTLYLNSRLATFFWFSMRERCSTLRSVRNSWLCYRLLSILVLIEPNSGGIFSSIVHWVVIWKSDQFFWTYSERNDTSLISMAHVCRDLNRNGAKIRVALVPQIPLVSIRQFHEILTPNRQRENNWLVSLSHFNCPGVARQTPPRRQRPNQWWALLC